VNNHSLPQVAGSCISRRCCVFQAGLELTGPIGGVSINRCALMAERGQARLGLRGQRRHRSPRHFEEISISCSATLASRRCRRSPSSGDDLESGSIAT